MKLVLLVAITATLAAAAELDCCTLNGHRVGRLQRKWIEYLGRNVVPALKGDHAAQVRTAANATWWTLKEGVLSKANPYRFSICTTDTGDAPLGALDECPPGRAWQVGIAAVQVITRADRIAAYEKRVLGVAKELYPRRSTEDLLAEAAQLAQLTKDEQKEVIASTGALRLSWLLRHPAVGITIVENEAVTECLEVARPKKWCFGAGWDDTRVFARDRAAALRTVSDLKLALDRLSDAAASSVR